MAEKDLIPFGQEGNELYDKSVRDKLKGSASDKRKEAQQLRRFKEKVEKGDLDDFDEETIKWITSSRYSAGKIIELIQELLKADLTTNQKLTLISKLIDTQKVLHPPIQKTAIMEYDVVRVEIVGDKEKEKDKMITLTDESEVAKGEVEEEE